MGRRGGGAVGRWGGGAVQVAAFRYVDQGSPPYTRGVKAYEKLDAWKACHQLVLEVYRATRSWPAKERFGLTTQARSSAFSAAANIAEGAAKRSHPEFRRYLDISLGSLSELSYILRLVRELGFASADSVDHLEVAREKAGKITWGLYASVSRRPTPPCHGD